ncbi:MAG: ABC transporter permease, partial [Gemmatimonadota bacterium]
MRNIWTIARKELRGYFDHPTAYILAVVFLVVNFFFFFRSVYLIGHASLRSMFDLLPWFLLFFVPAATMSSLAEERRHGTLEVLSSQPIQMYEILLGKYLGNLLFLLIVLTTTLLAPLTLTLGGKFDLGVVFAQYVGSALLLAAVTAVGVCASSLTRNQITAFIVGTAVTFFLILVGAEVLQIGLPAWLSSAIGQLGILPHFYNVTRGVLDLRD